MNKKGGIEDVFIDFQSYIAFTIIVLVFYLTFSFSGSENKETIEAKTEEFNANINIINYLNSEVNIEEGVYSLYDVIQIVCNKKASKEDYDDEIDILKQYAGKYKGEVSIIFQIKCQNDDWFLIMNDPYAYCTTYESITLPTIDKETIGIEYCINQHKLKTWGND